MTPRRSALALATAAWLALWASTPAAANPAGPLSTRIPSVERARFERMAEEAAISTRMEAEPYGVRPEVFEYLLDHPEFATHITRTLRLARYRIWHTAEGLFLEDGWGASGRFVPVYSAPGIRVMHAQGRYEQPLLPDIHGEALVVLEYAFRPDQPGHSLVATSVAGWLHLDNALLGLAGRLVGPLVQAKADREARQLLRVFDRVSHALGEHPAEVYEQLDRQPDVPRRELQEFGALLHLR